jgi:hypothetical protein
MDVWEWVPRLLGLWVVASIPAGLLIGRGLRGVSAEPPAVPAGAIDEDAGADLGAAVRVA